MNASPAPRRRRLVLLLVLGVVALPVVAELGLRVWSARERAGLLERHPAIAERVGRAMWTDPPPPEQVLGPVADAPAPVVRGEGADRRHSWTTWGAFPDEGFAAAPPPEPVPAGTVRIAVLGHATAKDITPERLQELLRARLVAAERPPAVEVLHLGVSSSDLLVTRLLAPRVLERWQPHLFVVHHGSNDVMRAEARLAALRTLVAGFPADPVPPGPRGLADLLRRRVLLPRADRAPIVRLALLDPFAFATEAWWSLSRLALRTGRGLVATTYPAPDYARLEPLVREGYDADLRFSYTAAGDVERYAARLAGFNAAARTFAAASDTPLADLAAALAKAGPELLFDNSHPTDAGAARQAEALAGTLLPLVMDLLDRGAPAPRPPDAGAGSNPSYPPGTAGDFAAVPGECVRGPCPEGACWIPAGAVNVGATAEARAELAAAWTEALGALPPGRVVDEGPPRRLRVSALCIDRTEVSAYDHEACLVAGRCPAAPAPNEPAHPAILPTRDDAEALCAFRGGRVPTDAEWTRAVFGDRTSRFPWGDIWGSGLANLCGAECPAGRADDPSDGHRGPEAPGAASHPGRFSPFGLFDGAGNVWEWVRDDWSPDALRTLPEGHADPVVQVDGAPGVLRGGSALTAPVAVERRRADDGLPDAAISLRGVRCAYAAAARLNPWPAPAAP